MTTFIAEVNPLAMLLKVLLTFNNNHLFRRGEEHHAEQKQNAVLSK